MTLKQLLGLSCKHRRLSWPIDHRQHCVECGAVFDFTAWTVDASERHTVEHYETRGSIKRVGHGVLTFKKRKEQSK